MAETTEIRESLVEFLRSLFLDEGRRRSFLADPPAVLTENGFEAVTSAELAAAVPAAIQTLPEQVAEGLGQAVPVVDASGEPVILTPPPGVMTAPAPIDGLESANGIGDPGVTGPGVGEDLLAPEPGIIGPNESEGPVDSAIAETIEDIQGEGSEVWEEFDESIDPLVDELHDQDLANDDYIGAAGTTLNILGSGGGSQADYLIDAAGELQGGVISAAGDGVGEAAGAVFGDEVGEGVERGFDFAGDVVSEGWDRQGDILQFGGESVGAIGEAGLDLVQDGADALQEGAGDAWDETSEAAGEAWDETSEAAGDAWDSTGGAAMDALGW